MTVTDLTAYVGRTIRLRRAPPRPDGVWFDRVVAIVNAAEGRATIAYTYDGSRHVSALATWMGVEVTECEPR